MLFDKIRINPSYASIGRAASRGVTDSLNFFIVNLVGQEIRRRMRSLPTEDGVGRLAQGYLAHDPENVAGGIDGFNEMMKGQAGEHNALGETIHATQNSHDKVGEATGESTVMAQDEEEAAVRTEQGFEVPELPLVTAARLKVIRDYIALDLERHARVEQSSMPNGKPYLSPHDTVQSFDEYIMRLLKRDNTVNEEKVMADAKANNMPFSDLLRIRRQDVARANKFMKDNATKILNMCENLSAVDQDGILLVADDAEDLFTDLAPIHQARMVIAADNGLWFYREQVMRAQGKGRPGSDGDRKLIAGARDDLRAELDLMFGNQRFYDAIDKAVLAGATWPVIGHDQESQIDPEWEARRLREKAEARAKAQRNQVQPGKLDELKSKFTHA